MSLCHWLFLSRQRLPLLFRWTLKRHQLAKVVLCVGALVNAADVYSAIQWRALAPVSSVPDALITGNQFLQGAYANPLIGIVVLRALTLFGLCLTLSAAK